MKYYTFVHQFLATPDIMPIFAKILMKQYYGYEY